MDGKGENLFQRQKLQTFVHTPIREIEGNEARGLHIVGYNMVASTPFGEST